MSARYHERMHNIEKILLIQNLQIDQTALREACLFGIPDKFRPLAWRLFLDYLPKERQKWAELLKKQRDYYKNLVDNFVVNPGYSNEDEPTEHAVADDHPLAQVDRLSGRSEWADYFKDNEVLKQIDNDVRRLRPEIDFFQRETNSSFRVPVDLGHRLQSDRLSASVHEIKFSNKSFITSCSSDQRTLSSSSSKSSQSEQSNNNNNNNETVEKHWQVVERVLFIYSKVNSGVKYVQGMNEIVGPIYYVFASDPDAEWAEHAEADAFYCFQNLMSEIKDLFIRTLDGSDCGIDAALTKFYWSLEELDPQLYAHLADQLCIRPQFYAFRWISLLLSQEFSLPDLIALWDTLFASSSRLDCAECICLAMVERVRDELLFGDFSQNLRLLQNYPAIDVSQLVVRALELLNITTSPSKLAPSPMSMRKNGNKLNKFGGVLMRTQMATLVSSTCQKMGRFATAAINQTQTQNATTSSSNGTAKEMKVVNEPRK